MWIVNNFDQLYLYKKFITEIHLQEFNTYTHFTKHDLPSPEKYFVQSYAGLKLHKIRLIYSIITKQ